MGRAWVVFWMLHPAAHPSRTGVQNGLHCLTGDASTGAMCTALMMCQWLTAWAAVSLLAGVDQSTVMVSW
jgi:hypothetical protein